MKIEWKTCFKIGLSIFLLYLCINFWPSVSGFLGALIGAAAPLLVGCGIAYVINIPMGVFEKYYFPRSFKKFFTVTRRPVCMTVSIIAVIAVVSLIVGLVVPQLISCIKLLISLLPGAIKELIAFLEDKNLLSDEVYSSLTAIDWKSKIGQIFEVLTSGLGSVMDVVITTVSSVIGIITTVFIGIIFAIYLLLDKERLGRQSSRILNRYLKESICGRISYVLSVFNECFRKYIVGQCTEAVILGVLCTIGMLILDIPYATMIGALIAFTALIPIAGAYIGAGVGAFMILTVSPIKAVIFLIFLVILQQLEGNLIYPHVVGSSMGLPGIWVLAAVTVGGGVMGIPGMLLGVPLVAALYKLLKNDINKKIITNTEETKIDFAE